MAVLGNVVAIAGVALHQITGSSVPDGGAAIVIGLGLAAVAFVLASRNRQFLIGEQAPQPLRDRLSSELRTLPGIDGIDGIDGVEELVVTFVGPRRVQVLARVDVDDTLSGREVEELVRRGERALRVASDAVTRVDVVPRGPDAPEETAAAGPGELIRRVTAPSPCARRSARPASRRPPRCTPARRRT